MTSSRRLFVPPHTVAKNFSRALNQCTIPGRTTASTPSPLPKDLPSDALTQETLRSQAMKQRTGPERIASTPSPLPKALPSDALTQETLRSQAMKQRTGPGRIASTPSSLPKDLPSDALTQETLRSQAMKQRTIPGRTASTPSSLPKDLPSDALTQETLRSQAMKQRTGPGRIASTPSSLPKDLPSDALTQETLRSQAMKQRTVHGRTASTPSSLPKDLSSDALTQETPPSGGDSNTGGNSNTVGDSNTVLTGDENEIEMEGFSSANPKKRSKNWKPRGPNRCKRLASLKDGVKLELTFFHNGPVGKNHHLFTSYMGMLVKNWNIVPIRIHSWNDIDEGVKDQLWVSITDKFQAKELNREQTLNHMKRLWHYWRGNLVKNYIKKVATKEEALENVPPNMPKSDWEWLVNEHFFKPEILRVRDRNSENREGLSMLHRTGSTPFRQIAYEDLGGKDGNIPTIDEIFKRTRQQKSGHMDEESAAKLKEIIDKGNKNPQYSTFDLLEDCFGVQNRGHVAYFGYGVKPSDVRGPLPSRVELQDMLRNKEMENMTLTKENKTLTKLVGTMESGMSKLGSQLGMVINLLKTAQPELGDRIYAIVNDGESNQT